jgi:hypothetical protein
MPESTNESRRVIMRIELLPEAKEELAIFSDRTGLTQVAITSRLVEWFCSENDVVQAAVLGLYPADVRNELPAMILKGMAATRKTDT